MFRVVLTFLLSIPLTAYAVGGVSLMRDVVEKIYIDVGEGRAVLARTLKAEQKSQSWQAQDIKLSSLLFLPQRRKYLLSYKNGVLTLPDNTISFSKAYFDSGLVMEDAYGFLSEKKFSAKKIVYRSYEGVLISDRVYFFSEKLVRVKKDYRVKIVKTALYQYE